MEWNKKYPVCLAIVLSMSCFWAGCEKKQVQQPANNLVADGLSAQSILAATLQTYLAAPSYQDAGMLYLSYRLHGNLIQEQQPWRVAFRRPGMVAGDWFNARIRCDQAQLGCFIFDNDTANLDNQWLLLNAAQGIPLQKLLSDPIARQFVTGQGELPLNETKPVDPFQLIPPVTGLLTGISPWPLLANPDTAIRLADATVDELPCYHLQLQAGELLADCWIDQESWLIRQIKLPLELLDPTVRSSSDVEDVQFFARMHDCCFSSGEEMSLGNFAVVAPDAAVPVRHLLAPPEEFPCELIGKQAPRTDFKSCEGWLPVESPIRDQTVVLVWLPSNLPADVLDQLIEVGRACPKARVIGVLNDSHFQNQDSGPVMSDDVAAAVKSLAGLVECCVDPGMMAWQQMRARIAACAIVMDSQGRVQYAQNIFDSAWVEKVAAAVSRVGNGEDLAAEMRGDYALYIETYHRKLEMVSATKDSVQTENEYVGDWPVPASRTWQCPGLKQPGNIAVTSAGKIAVTEGWRSVALIDRSGKLEGTRELDLPAGVAISRLRRLEFGSETGWLAFTVLGPAIFRFDEEWNLAGNIQGDSSADRVLDCAAFRENGKPSLIVSYDKSGVHFFEGLQTPRIVAKQRLEQVVRSGNNVAGLASGQIWNIADELAQPVIRQGVVTNIVARHRSGSPDLDRERDELSPIVVGMNENRMWTLSEMNPANGPGVEVPIGPQLFESQIEPLVVEKKTGWIISADSNGIVRVLNDRLQMVSRFSPGVMSGIAADSFDDRIVVYCALGNRLEAWQIPLAGASERADR